MKLIGEGGKAWAITEMTDVELALVLTALDNAGLMNADAVIDALEETDDAEA